jgi:F420-dependent oxidoreductase-like protein
MKIGIGLGYSSARIELPIKMVQRAEELGYDSVWCWETYGSDALTPLAYIAGHTKKIRLGTAIAQLAARTPANFAMCAQTIDALAGEGRMMLGLGVSGPQIVEGWYGQPWGKPNHRLREAVSIIRQIWRREGPVSLDGEEYQLPYRGPGSSGLGKPLKSVLHGNPNIPIYLGTGTPTNIRMTAEIADGWLSANKLVPGRQDYYRKIIAEGLARRTDGKAKDFTIYGNVHVHITDDVRTALDAVKPHVALYVGGMGAKSMNFHKDNMVNRGYAAAADRIQELFLAGRKDEAAAAVPDEFVDDGMLLGPPDRIRQRWKPWTELGLAGITFSEPTPEVVELMAKVARG